MNQVSRHADIEQLSIKPRKMNFPFEQVTQRFFFDNNALKSAFVAALSATFPAGEGEFIESVRRFRDKTNDPELLEQIRGFIGQEGHHSLQHKRFNQALRQLGFDAVKLESVFEKDLAYTIKNKSDRERLAYTVCFEHQTAILADYFFRETSALDGLDETIKDLILWHTVEEIEHKAVAFDLFMTCDGDRALLKKAQKEATRLFSWRISKYMVFLLWWARIFPGWKDIKGYASFMFGKKGLMTKLREPYRDFFREDFHPWDHQNLHLVDEWKQNHYRPEQNRASEHYTEKAK